MRRNFSLCSKRCADNMPERIQLTFGSPDWLAFSRLSVAVIAALNILFSSIGPSWKLLLLAALVLVSWSCAHRKGLRPGWNMRSDGTVWHDGQEGSRHRLIDGSAWLTPWLSVFRIRDPDSGKVRTCVVSAALNHDDDYRRMRVFLRMRSERKEGTTIWPWT